MDFFIVYACFFYGGDPSHLTFIRVSLVNVTRSVDNAIDFKIHVFVALNWEVILALFLTNLSWCENFLERNLTICGEFHGPSLDRPSVNVVDF